MSGFAECAAELTRAAIGHRLFPGSTVGWLVAGRAEVRAFGRFTYEPAATAVVPGTVYDVASLTKSVPTALLVMQELEAGRLSLHTRVVEYVPELGSRYRDQITIRHLLTYTVIFDQPHGLSGLVALYGQDFLDQALAGELTDPPGRRYFYTNPPALILGLVLERSLGKGLAALAQERLFGPLGLHDTGYDTAALGLDRIPPSEVADGQVIAGIVHDESARAMAKMGRTAGHAGVFSTAGDLLTVADMLIHGGRLRDTTFLSPETVARMAENQIVALGEHTGLGWEINRPDVMGTAARGHVLIKSGHTGCLLVVDLAHKAALVMLSNRTYPQRGDREDLRAYWRSMNEAFWQGLKSS